MTMAMTIATIGRRMKKSAMSQRLLTESSPADCAMGRTLEPARTF